MIDQDRKDAEHFGWVAIENSPQMADADHYTTDTAHHFFCKGYMSACRGKRAELARSEDRRQYTCVQLDNAKGWLEAERAKSADLAMICRRLAAAKTLELRDRIAEQCAELFEGKVTRD